MTYECSSHSGWLIVYGILGENCVNQKGRAAMWVLRQEVWWEAIQGHSGMVFLAKYCLSPSASVKVETPSKPLKALLCFYRLHNLLLEGCFIVGMARLTPKSRETKNLVLLLFFFNLIFHLKSNAWVLLSSKTLQLKLIPSLNITQNLGLLPWSLKITSDQKFGL